MLDIVQAVEGDCDVLGRILRKEDAEEMAAMGFDGVEALYYALIASRQAWTALDDGIPIAMWGWSAESLFSVKASVWLLTSYGVLRHVKPLLRAGKKFVDELSEAFPVLESTGDLTYTGGVALARYLGFEDHEPLVFGGRPFARMRRLSCASTSPPSA